MSCCKQKIVFVITEDLKLNYYEGLVVGDPTLLGASKWKFKLLKGNKVLFKGYSNVRGSKTPLSDFGDEFGCNKIKY
jgi:hypothetical protein